MKQSQGIRVSDCAIAGVDDCEAGWCVAYAQVAEREIRIPQLRIVRRFEEILALLGGDGIVAVDIPIGLTDYARRGGRDADRMARKLLGPRRGRSVFSTPIRGVLSCASHAEASAKSRASSADRRALSIQAFNIMPKIAEVDAALTPELQKRILEVHPEVCSCEMQGGPVVASKKTPDGQCIRTTLLSQSGFGFVNKALERRVAKEGAAADDIIDAHAALWTAHRFATGQARRIPENPPADSKGLRMEMWV